jgi:putative membrane protein
MSSPPAFVAMMTDEQELRSQHEERQAQHRTDLAEDRTILANERTFASWFRTGFAAVGIGLGFQALFVKMEPSWVPRVIATLFLLLGIFLFVSAEMRACEVLQRLKAHEVKSFRNARLRLMTTVATLGVLALIAAMWLLPFRPS